VERLYRQLQAEGRTDILPLVNDLTNPSPGLGWRGRERRRLEERGKPDLILCLALLHHLVLTGNVPVSEVMEWLAELGGHLVVEMVTKEDPMARKLLLNKVDNYLDYEVPAFEDHLGRHFEVLERQPLQSGTRILYFARPLPR
jgi:hypothetical protein